MSEVVQDARAIMNMKKLKGRTRNRSKSKDRWAHKDKYRDHDDAREAGIKIRKWKHR